MFTNLDASLLDIVPSDCKAYIKNLRAEKWCLDAIDRSLDDALFWNDLSMIYLEAGLLYEGRKYYSMAYDILDSVAGRYDKPIFYIPRGSKVL